jgi:ectoine hydroxylase-related dioxygenase (phytanoyl-CoA dioxygenase family)
MPRFVDIVEDVTSLSVKEMEEIKNIIEKLLIEKKREEILKSIEEAKKEAKEGKLKFYDNSNDLMSSLNEPD